MLYYLLIPPIIPVALFFLFGVSVCFFRYFLELAKKSRKHEDEKRGALKTNKNSYFYIVICLSLLIVAFEIVYVFFYFQVGLPASKNQDDIDLKLSASDWLSFFGSYLGFAGSLIMAFVVYKQDQKITELTLQEYQPALYFRITGYSIKDINSITSPMIKDCDSTDYLRCDASQTETYESAVPDNQRCILYISLKNIGKQPLTGFMFESIEVEQNSEYEKKYELIDSDINKMELSLRPWEPDCSINIAIVLKPCKEFWDNAKSKCRILYTCSGGKKPLYFNFIIQMVRDEHSGKIKAFIHDGQARAERRGF